MIITLKGPPTHLSQSQSNCASATADVHERWRCAAFAEIGYRRIEQVRGWCVDYSHKQ